MPLGVRAPALGLSHTRANDHLCWPGWHSAHVNRAIQNGILGRCFDPDCNLDLHYRNKKVTTL